jgi:flagellar biosynthetic protein FliR
MSAPAGELVTAFLLVLCRVGGCLMLVPGYSAAFVPMPVRLYIAVAVSLCLMPLVGGGLAVVAAAEGARLLALIAAECLAGALLGLTARCLLSAFNLVLAMIAQTAGLAGQIGPADGGDEPTPELTALVQAAVLALLFINDFHLDVLRALVESYRALPPGTATDLALTLDRLAAAMAEAFRLAMRIAGPFLLAGLLINLAFGLVNKVAPAIPVIFISAPFVVVAALWLLLLIGGEMAGQISAAMLKWLARA